MTEPGFDEATLQAYVDDALPAAQRAQVEAWLAEHPDQAARLAAYGTINQHLHTVFDPLLHGPVPPALTRALRPALSRRRFVQAAAGLGVFVAGGGAGWLLGAVRRGDRGGAQPLGFVENALGAHAVFAVDKGRPVEIAAAQEAQLVRWLGKRLRRRFRAPDLRPAGFELVGGRLLPDDGRPAAQLMYEDRAGRRVTGFIRFDPGWAETAFRFFSRDGLSAFYWVDGGAAYALVGGLPRAELLALAKLVYDRWQIDDRLPG